MDISNESQDQQVSDETVCVTAEFHETVLDDALELEAPDTDDETADTSTNTVIFIPSNSASSDVRAGDESSKQTALHGDGDRSGSVRRSSETSLPSRSALTTDSKGSVSHRRRQWGSQTADRSNADAPSISSDSLEKLVPTLTIPSDHKQKHHGSSLKTDTSKPSADLTSALSGKAESDALAPVNGEAEQEAHITPEIDPKQVSHNARGDKNSGKTTKSNVGASGDSQNGETVSNSTTQKKTSPSKRKGPKETKAVGYLIESPERVEPCAPAKHRPTNIVYIRSLVRPFTADQLRQMISEQFGPVTDLWLDRIKSSSLVKLDSVETAIRCREGLDGCRWPSMNPRTLVCDFGNDDLFAWMKEHGNSGDRSPPKYLILGEKPPSATEPEEVDNAPLRAGKKPEAGSKTRVDTKSTDRTSSKAERNVSDASARPLRTDNKDKEAPDVKRRCEEPAKLLDDLFRKTTCTPCIYWLPLTAEQAQKQAVERAKLLRTNPSSAARPPTRPITTGPTQRATRSPFTSPSGPDRSLAAASAPEKNASKPARNRSSSGPLSSSRTRSDPIEGVPPTEPSTKTNAPDRPDQSAQSPIPPNESGKRSRARSHSSSGSTHRRNRPRKQSPISPARESATSRARERRPTESVSRSGRINSRKRDSSSRSPPRPRATRRSTSSRSRSRSSPYHNRTRRGHASGLPSKTSLYRSGARLRSRSPRSRKSPVRARR